MVGRVHGTGKSILGEIMRDVYGPRNYAKIENKDLSGRSFNKWLEGRQFLLGNEISMDDRRIVTSIIKSMITDDTLVVEPKGGERYVIDDFANYYFTSNHIDTFNLEDTDRRFFVHEVAASAPFNDRFYEQYHRWKEQGGAAFLFRHLLDVNLGDFHPKVKPPFTESKKKMIAFTKNDVAAWAAMVREFPEDYFPEDCLPPEKKRGSTSEEKRSTSEENPRGTCWATSDDVRRTYDPLNQSPRITANVITRVMTAAGFQDLNPHGNVPISSGRRGQRIWLIRGPRPSTQQVEEWYVGKMPKLPGGKANPAYKAPVRVM
jgi:phage/plasmid-associated DNA primase